MDIRNKKQDKNLLIVWIVIKDAKGSNVSFRKFKYLLFSNNLGSLKTKRPFYYNK